MKMRAEIQNNVPKYARRASGLAPGRIQKAVNKAGGVVKRDAQSRAQYKNVANAIIVAEGSGRRQIDKNMPEARVGFKRGKKGDKTAWYGKFFETGTRSHKIAPKNWSGQLSWPVEAGHFNVKMKSGKIRMKKFYSQGAGLTTKIKAADWVYLKKGMTVNHPGMQAKPMLIPAREAKKEEVKNIIADAVLKVMANAKEGI